MGDIARGTKAAGGTAFVDGTAASATEVNTDFDTVYNKVNGNLDEDSLAPATQIPNSKLVTIEPEIVNDSSLTEAALAATLDAGDSSGVTLPTNLREELQALRYRVRANRHMGTNLQYMLDAGTLAAAYWTEPAPNGPNLAPNPGLEAHSGTATDAPTGWSLVGTPTTMGPIGPGNPSQGLEKRAFRVLADAAGEGISYSVGGLKSSTKYLIGVTYTLEVDEFNVIVASGLATGDYKNASYTDTTTVAASATATRQFIVKSTAAAGNMSVSFLGTNNGADFKIHSVWFYELSEAAPRDVPPVMIQTASTTTGQTIPAVATADWAYDTVTELSLSQYIPYAGYRLVYEVTLSASSNNNADDNHYYGYQISLDSGAGVNVVEGPFHHLTNANGSANFAVGQIVTMKHIVDNPTPGSTYAFTTQAGAHNTSAADHSKVVISDTKDSVVGASSAKLYLERL